MKRLAFILLFLALKVTPAWAISTLLVTVNNSGWVDLTQALISGGAMAAAGNVQIASVGDAVYAISDATPTITVGFPILHNQGQSIATTSHVWGRATGPYSTSIIISPSS